MKQRSRISPTEGTPTEIDKCRPIGGTVSIIVPTYREEENIAELTMQIFNAVHPAGIQAELIVVDDNSCDGTIELCEQLSREYPIRLITRTEERGLATAVIRGLQEARGHYLIVMDADLSHPAASIPDLLMPLVSGSADFVIGSRYVDGGTVDESWSFLRHLNSRIAGLLAIGLTQARDPMAGFFALRRDSLVNPSTLNPCGYKIGLELMVHCACERVMDVPIHFEDRKHGESKLNIREQWLYLRHLVRLYAFRYPEVLRFVRFGAVGTSGMLLDLATFRGLLPFVGLAISRAIAIWAAMTWNFEFNRRFTFHEPKSSHWLVAYCRFCTACLLGAGISWSTSLTLMHASESFTTRPIGAAAIGTGIAALFNYALCRLWVFGRRESLPAIAISALPPKPVLDTPISQSRTAA